MGAASTAAATVLYQIYRPKPDAVSWLNLSLQTLFAVGAPALSLSYAAGLILLFHRGRRWLAALAPLGRMALTNYLMQSVIAPTIFYSYGFGLYGRVGPAVGLWITICICRRKSY